MLPFAMGPLHSAEETLGNRLIALNPYEKGVRQLESIVS